MFEPQQLNDLAKRIAEAVPQDLIAIKGDLENNVKAILQASRGRMNLVTREEFEIQRKVLLKTREQLEILETRIHTLEALAGKD
jgi:BMFP domain-containing protein YqiC